MRIKPFILTCLLIGHSAIAYTAPWLTDMPNRSKAKPNGALSQIVGKFMFGYTDFTFDSSSEANYNRYQGHAGLYSLTADHFQFTRDINAGIALFKVNTHLRSQVLLQPGTASTGSQSIQNDTLFGHLLKRFNDRFLIDLSAGYGQNTVSTLSDITPIDQAPQTGHAHYINHNWLAAVNGLYKKPWKRYLFQVSAGVLQTQINTGSYPVVFQTIANRNVQPLTTKTTLLLENLEVGYKLTPNLTPFVTGGLVQVVHFSNSRAIVIVPINGTLPQLSMNKDAFRLAAGALFKVKKFTLKIEERYYNSAGTFRSNQTLFGIEYHFS